jgi:hypothetical protein
MSNRIPHRVAARTLAERALLIEGGAFIGRTVAELKAMRAPDLRAICRAHELPVAGKRSKTNCARAIARAVEV